MPAIYTDARPGLAPTSNGFVKGVAMGAGLVVLGVIVGGVCGRRR